MVDAGSATVAVASPAPAGVSASGAWHLGAVGDDADRDGRECSSSSTKARPTSVSAVGFGASMRSVWSGGAANVVVHQVLVSPSRTLEGR